MVFGTNYVLFAYSLVSTSNPGCHRSRKNTLTIDANHATNENAYLSEPLHNLILNKLNEDATELFRAVFLIKGDQEAVKGYVLM